MIDPFQIHRESFVFDSHVDTVGRMLYRRDAEAANDRGRMQIDIPKLRQGGYGGLFFAAYIPPDDPRPTWRAFSILELTKKWVARNAAHLALVTSMHELNAARRAKKIAAMHSLENGGLAIDGNLDLIDTFYEAGVRCFGLVWNAPNCLAAGAGQPKTRRGLMGRPRSRKGLTPMGKRAIRLLNERGMLVDVSHINDAGFRDVMRLARAPIVATHSNAYSLCKVFRNLTDDQIKALAGTGGVIGVNFVPDFLTCDEESSVTDVVDHIEYIASLVGVDHVGLGTDYDGCQPPRDLSHAGKLPSLTRELVRRGWRKSEIRKILGGNYLRVMHQVIG